MPLPIRCLVLACALALPSLALAQARPAGDPATATATDPATELDQVTVTATRTAIAVASSLAPVQVIDRAAIERSQARSLPDLLRGRAGISLANQGGAGKLTTLYLRGSESDHVLVLVDGVRIGSATSGLASFQDLPIDPIHRVQIVRRPAPSLPRSGPDSTRSTRYSAWLRLMSRGRMGIPSRRASATRSRLGYMPGSGVGTPDRKCAGQWALSHADW